MTLWNLILAWIKERYGTLTPSPLRAEAVGAWRAVPKVGMSEVHCPQQASPIGQIPRFALHGKCQPKNLSMKEGRAGVGMGEVRAADLDRRPDSRHLGGAYAFKNSEASRLHSAEIVLYLGVELATGGVLC